MPKFDTPHRKLADERADVFYELTNQALLPGQTIQPNGSVTNTDGLDVYTGNVGDILAAVVTEGDGRFKNVPADTLQALALAAFRLGVQAAETSGIKS